MEHDGCKGCRYENKTEDSIYCKGCKQNAVDKYVKMTNADKIRNMTDEELAEFLDVMVVDGLDCVLGLPCDYCMEKCECESCIKEWLERECDVE